MIFKNAQKISREQKEQHKHTPHSDIRSNEYMESHDQFRSDDLDVGRRDVSLVSTGSLNSDPAVALILLHQTQLLARPHGHGALAAAWNTHTHTRVSDRGSWEDRTDLNFHLLHSRNKHVANALRGPAALRRRARHIETYNKYIFCVLSRPNSK